MPSAGKSNFICFKKASRWTNLNMNMNICFNQKSSDPTSEPDATGNETWDPNQILPGTATHRGNNYSGKF